MKAKKIQTYFQRENDGIWLFYFWLAIFMEVAFQSIDIINILKLDIVRA